MKAHTLLAILTLPVLFAACSPTMANRGNIMDQDKLAEIKAGVSTREQVASALGTPTQISTFDNNTWYYVGRQTEQYSFLDPDVIKQHAVEVDFDENGVVKTVKNLDLSQTRDIDMAGGATPTYGRDDTLLRQLIGDVGHPSVQTGRKSNPGG